MTQFGMYSETTPRNDASPRAASGISMTAYRYVSEAYGGYHFNALHGINLDAGIFMSYIGLFSYYNFDNWAYQPSYVSSNTPWFFNGVRVQIFPTEKLKIEPWFINGWQSYGLFNNRPGMGGQILWRPNSWMSIISNNYGVGHDALGIPNRSRIHTDNSLEVKYYDRPGKPPGQDGILLHRRCGLRIRRRRQLHGNGKAAQAELPRLHGLQPLLVQKRPLRIDAGRRRNQQSRPLPGPAAAHQRRNRLRTGTPYFTENPGDPFKAWDAPAPLTTCPSSTSPSAGSTPIALPMFRISRAAGA